MYMTLFLFFFFLISAAEPKFGTCPFVEPNANKRICQDGCESDDDCSGIEKCCRGSSGCNKCFLPSELNRKLTIGPKVYFIGLCLVW